MVFRTAGAAATLMICLAGTGGQSAAQYYPPPQPYPPQAYRPPQGYTPRQPLPPTSDAEEDAPPLNAPVMQAPLPPVGGGPQGNEPPASTRYLCSRPLSVSCAPVLCSQSGVQGLAPHEAGVIEKVGAAR